MPPNSPVECSAEDVSYREQHGLTAIGWVDYLIVLASLAVCVYIGLRKPKGSGAKVIDTEKEVEDLTVGGRNMAMVPVAFSIMATLLSGNAITSAVGEVYKYGILSLFLPISGLLSKLFVGYVIVPVFHYIKYVSIYEYVELRFDRTFRLIFSGLYIISHLLYLGISLYSPALAVSMLTGIHYGIVVTILGLVCGIYCVLGGLKAVIWTDVFQAGLMFFCVLTIIVKATWDVGSFGIIFEKTFDPANMELHFALTEDPAFRYSIWAVNFAGIADTFKTTIVSQAGAQRLLCVDSPKTAMKSLMLGAGLMLIFKILTVIAAMAVYANFHECDPMFMPCRTGIKREDEMFIYGVNQFMSHIPGLQGLVLAGLISATLSTCSSLINAFAALTLEDFAKPLFPNWTKNTETQLVVCKLCTLLYAILAIALSFMTPYLGGVAKAALGVISSLTGPLCGIMILGLFFSRTNLKAYKISFVLSMIFVLWLTIGGLISNKPDKTLCRGLKGCPDYNTTNPETTPVSKVTEFSLVNSTILVNATDFENGTWFRETSPNPIMFDCHVPEEEADRYIFPLYLISFMWLGPIGVAMTIVLAVVLTCIMGGTKCQDKRLLSPMVTTTWWKIRRNQRKPFALLPTNSESVQDTEESI